MRNKVGALATSVLLLGAAGIAAAPMASAAPTNCGGAIISYSTVRGGCWSGQGYFRVTASCAWGGSRSSSWVYRSASSGYTSTTVACGLGAYATGVIISTKD